MDTILQSIVWNQFGAAIDMFGNAVQACPEDLWHENLWLESSQTSEFSEVWSVIFHTLFWLDLYLSGSKEDFAPPDPFGLEELDPSGAVSETPYTKNELIDYMTYCRSKCKNTIASMTPELADKPCQFSWGEISFAELLLYNMRHVQEHTAQLNLFLGNKIGWSPGWVKQAR